MNRRDLLRSSALSVASLFVGSRCAYAANTFTALTEMKKLQITSGPMTGAFVIAPYGYVNWYFANVGLYPYVSSMQAQVKAYLNLYLSRVDPNRSNIADVLLTYSGNPQSATIAGTQYQDSDDAYAGTFLSLASQYDAVFNDTAWWNANVAALKNIAYRNLAVDAKPGSGLIRCYQDTTRPDGTVGFCMDNCEAWRGLTDFAARLKAHGDLVNAAYYSLVATGVGIGIHSLFSTKQNAFLSNDTEVSIGTDFYPDATAQVFPQAYGVTASGLGVTQYNAAWTYLNSAASGWQNGTYNEFPWMILGYVAALRGGSDASKAVTQMHMLEALFKSNRALVTINELGFYKRTADVLGVAS